MLVGREVENQMWDSIGFNSTTCYDDNWVDYSSAFHSCITYINFVYSYEYIKYLNKVNIPGEVENQRTVGSLVEELYDTACESKNWALVRHTTGKSTTKPTIYTTIHSRYTEKRNSKAQLHTYSSEKIYVWKNCVGIIQIRPKDELNNTYIYSKYTNSIVF